MFNRRGLRQPGRGTKLFHVETSLGLFLFAGTTAPAAARKTSQSSRSSEDKSREPILAKVMIVTGPETSAAGFLDLTRATLPPVEDSMQPNIGIIHYPSRLKSLLPPPPPFLDYAIVDKKTVPKSAWILD